MDGVDLSLIAEIAGGLPVGLWVARAPGGEFVYANRAFAEIMGQSGRDDVAAGAYAEPYGIYTRDGKLYPEDRMPFVRALQERTTVVIDDISIHRGDGTRVAVRAFAKPLLDARGGMAYVVIAFFDVTREAEAIRSQREAEQLLHRVLDKAPLLLFAYDTTGRLTVSEGHALAGLGLRPRQHVGQSVFDLYRNSPEILANVRRSLAGEEFQSRVRVGGRWMESMLAPLRDETGAVCGGIGVSIDVTEAERLQERLLESDRLAALGTIAAGVAHEINTPLAYVAASLEHVARELPRLAQGAAPSGLLDSLLRLTDEARAGLRRVETIARDLNSFSRPHEQQTLLSVQSVLESVLRMIANEVQLRATLVRDYGEVSPVLANEARLAQVFLNLLLNAAQAMPARRSTLAEIRVATRQEGAWVRIEVSDDGPGIPPDLLPRVFEPFFTTKPAGQGTGLGLGISRGIVESLGGRIEVESPPGRGTTVRVRLPGHAAMQAGGEPSSQRSGVPGRPRLLVIDDDPAFGRVLRVTLAEAFDLDVAAGGAQALPLLLSGQSYDLVFCDLMMPGMSGMDLHERLQAERPAVADQICFMTAGAFDARAREFLARIPNRRFEKPFDFYEVAARILRERAG